MNARNPRLIDAPPTSPWWSRLACAIGVTIFLIAVAFVMMVITAKAGG